MSTLQIGIVGLPNVGKSTLFNAITRAGAVAANFPFATIDKNVGVVALPDERLDALAKVFTKGERVPPIIPTSVEFVDIAGLVKGASKGEGLGNQFLANIREVDAIAHVVRCFADDNIVHVAGTVDPLSDIETINTELILADLTTMERRVERLRKSAKSSKDDAELLALAQEVLAVLERGEPARAGSYESPLPRDFGLLTIKPVIYVANVAESELAQDNELVTAVREFAAQEGAEIVKISAQIEGELAEMPQEDAAAFLADLGIDEPGLNKLIHVGYKTLGLITFITSGEKEVRAWTIIRGTKAPQAAGTIHSDFERGFIRAEVIAWDKMVEAGSWAAAKSKGWVRTEGKEYVMQDGDIMNVLFNV
ncbi:redox-regulated ATPase YchF [Deinococcus peraridilitoris]|uniref:Ribosome-binding ATPase YchF n=1 Tax=Deinococcus peraridilitoris (strain DSM 19664 / LMG 22246 / CIP 109416 / KR-200) TaxID=937777 RepID=L0A0C6_DEIPD|nr:redox-regulated ATPase YchF [Deinococcus peraridilitoris]AFZ66470.1 GTP-binding protein YchF [Deinococcus peraridilitoris DSM 19664]